jgi:hypothetical protein
MPSLGSSHVEIVIDSGLANEGVSLVRESVAAIKVAVIPKAARRLQEMGECLRQNGVAD